MVSGKKLNISPLPEQRDDYSQYAESEIRWDRIVIAGVLILLVVIALLSLLFGDDAENSSAPLAIANEVAIELPEKPPESLSTLAAEPALSSASEHKRDEASQKKNASEVPLAVMPMSESPEAKPRKLEEPVQKPQAPSSEVSKPVVQLEPVAKEPVESAKTEDLKPASVLIVNSGIKEAVLSLSLNKDQPGEPLSHSVVMNEGLIKVILYTEMQGLNGKVLYHEWYRDGKRQARVRIPVNVRNQNSYSSKFIDKYMLGQWQVKVVDGSGEPYVLADFEVTRAP